ncbi:MAG TPA: TraR/DksA family transcriptional regulator [Burkholderiaceae bacterium]|nr:TraR/DksA family transcriptional regulator [Burkholderiaceae bacterium]
MTTIAEDPQALTQIRAALISRQAELREAVHAAEQIRRGEPLDRTEVGDSKDMSAGRQQADVDEAQEQRDIDELRQVDAALARLAAGDYGLCVDCGEAIAARRLLVQPAAPRCVGCQQRVER